MLLVLVIVNADARGTHFSGFEIRGSRLRQEGEKRLDYSPVINFQNFFFPAFVHSFSMRQIAYFRKTIRCEDYYPYCLAKGKNEYRE